VTADSPPALTDDPPVPPDAVYTPPDPPLELPPVAVPPELWALPPPADGAAPVASSTAPASLPPLAVELSESEEQPFASATATTKRFRTRDDRRIGLPTAVSRCPTWGLTL
jgi:hypothetical protein